MAKVDIMSAVLATLLFLAPFANGHSLVLGRCREVPGMADFDVERFSGLWYVNEAYATINSCITLDYQPRLDGSEEIKISQRRQVFPLDAAGIDHTANYVGIAVPKGEIPSEMNIKWPVSSTLIRSDMTHNIVTTDYDTFALTYECQNIFGLANRVSAKILSRTPVLDADQVAALKQIAEENNVPRIENFRSVSQDNCVEPGEGIDINTDTENFNLLGLIDEEKLGNITTKEELVLALGDDPTKVTTSP